MSRSIAGRVKRPTYAELLEAVTNVAHMRCDGDEFFGAKDGEDISNDHLQDQMVEAVTMCRSALGIQESGPTQKPTEVGRSS